MNANTVIIGGGQAGAQVAFSLRQSGYDGKISIVCEEAYAPYQRPPLSKAYLLGKLERDRLFFKPRSWYQDHNIDLLLETHAESLDRKSHTVFLSDGQILEYDTLVLATGATPRQLPFPGANAHSVYALRSIADTDRISKSVHPNSQVAIIGGGYIGLETAAALRQTGAQVTVLEYAPCVLQRVTSPIISEFFETLHSKHGVRILNNARVLSLESHVNHASEVLLSNDERIPASIVIAGIGVDPETKLAKDAGLLCTTGIEVDDSGRTSDPHIFAAGDCTTRPLVHYGRKGRLEGVHNAIEQGKAVAAAIMGKPCPNFDCPWFWSDQYDVKLQIAGISEGFDETIVRGDTSSERFSVFYFKQDKLIAVDAINDPPSFLVTKKMIAAGQSPDRSQLADLSKSLKDIAASAKVLEGAI